MTPAELHTHLREVVAIGRRGGYDNDEIAANLARVVRAFAADAEAKVARVEALLDDRYPGEPVIDAEDLRAALRGER